MINAYSITSQTVQTEEAITFNINRVKTGCTVSHAAGTTSFTFNKPGFYLVNFNADVTSPSTGNVVVDFYINGTAIPGAEATATITTITTQVENLGCSTIVQVRPSCAAIDNTSTLTVVNNGNTAVVSNASIIITKLA